MTDPADPSRPTDPSAPPEPDPGTIGPRWQGRWDRLPRPARVMLLVLGFVAIMFVARVLPELLFDESSNKRNLYTVGLLVAAGIVIALSVRRQRRAFGGAEQMRLYRQALKDGEVPPQANREAWRAGLEKQVRAMPWVLRFHVIVYVVPVPLLAVAIVVILASGELSLAAALPMAILGVAAFFGIWWSLRSLRRQRDRAVALLEQL